MRTSPLTEKDTAAFQVENLTQRAEALERRIKSLRSIVVIYKLDHEGKRRTRLLIEDYTARAAALRGQLADVEGTD